MLPHLLKCLLAASLLLAAAKALRADDLLDPTPIQKNNISIQLPKDWKPQPRNSAHILLAAAAPTTDTDTTGDYAAALTITIAPGSSIDGPAQQDHLAHEIANYQVTEKSAPLTIGTLDAITFGGTFTKGSLKLRSRQYLLTHADHIYTLTITALASRWDQHIAATEAGIHTFTINKK